MHRWENDKFYQSTSRVNSACGGENKLNCVGIIDGKGHEIRRRIYHSNGISPTLCGIGCGGNTEPKIVVGAAMRGRYNSDGKTEQKIETRDDELSNAITTVQKDSLVVENFQKPPTD